MYRLRCRNFANVFERTSMAYSVSASKAKAIHDAAMSIIQSEAKERALRTERLRQLRLAAEAEAGTIDRVAVPRIKSRRAGS
jgi:hypothetical protein